MGRVYRHALSTSMILAVVGALPAPAPQLFGSRPSGTTSTTGSNLLGDALGGLTGILSPILSGPAAPVVSSPAAIPSTNSNTSLVGGVAAPVPATNPGTGLLDGLGSAFGSALTSTTGSAPNTNTAALPNINAEIGIIDGLLPVTSPLGGLLSGAGQVLDNTLTAGTGAVGGLVQGAGTALGDVLQALGSALGGATGDLIGALGQAVDNVLGGVGQTVETAGAGLGGLTADIATALDQLGFGSSVGLPDTDVDNTLPSNGLGGLGSSLPAVGLPSLPGALSDLGGLLNPDNINLLSNSDVGNLGDIPSDILNGNLGGVVPDALGGLPTIGGLPGAGDAGNLLTAGIGLPGLGGLLNLGDGTSNLIDVIPDIPNGDWTDVVSDALGDLLTTGGIGVLLDATGPVPSVDGPPNLGGTPSVPKEGFGLPYPDVILSPIVDTSSPTLASPTLDLPNVGNMGGNSVDNTLDDLISGGLPVGSGNPIIDVLNGVGDVVDNVGNTVGGLISDVAAGTIPGVYSSSDPLTDIIDSVGNTIGDVTSTRGEVVNNFTPDVPGFPGGNLPSTPDLPNTGGVTSFSNVPTTQNFGATLPGTIPLLPGVTLPGVNVSTGGVSGAGINSPIGSVGIGGGSDLELGVSPVEIPPISVPIIASAGVDVQDFPGVDFPTVPVFTIPDLPIGGDALSVDVPDGDTPAVPVMPVIDLLTQSPIDPVNSFPQNPTLMFYTIPLLAILWQLTLQQISLLTLSLMLHLSLLSAH